MKKGDTVLLRYAFSIVEVKVVKVYKRGYAKVRSKDYFKTMWLHQIIHESEILG